MDRIWQKLEEYKKPILGAALASAAIWGAYKVYCGMDNRHSCLAGGKTLDEPDQKRFPNYFANRDGLWIHTRQWEVPEPKGVVFISHGLGEHIGRYESLARRLTSEGFSVYGMDHQGHGLSHGDRVHVASFKHLPRDFHQFMRRVQSRLGDPLPCFLLGHSMGALIAAYVAKTLPEDCWPLRGLVLSAGAFKPGPDVNPLTIKLVGVINAVRPKTILPDKIEPSNLSAHNQVPVHYLRDPGVYSGGMRVSIANALLKAMLRLDMKGLNPATHVLVLHGTADTVCDPRGSEEMMQHLGTNPKELKTYWNVRHELLWEEQPVEDVCAFFRAKLDA